jgi:hypothetical protein
MQLPAKNLYWKHIKPTDTVTSSRVSFVFVVTRDGEKYLVNWGENDKRAAMNFLKSRTT